MEYMLTYGWMILIVAIALSALYLMGVFNSGALVGDTCTMPIGFTCSGTVLTTYGYLSLSIEQGTTSSINVTAIGCNTNVTTANMQQESPQVSIPSGGSHTFNLIQCYVGPSVFSGSIGSIYRGYLIMNYTDMSTGLSHTATGSVLLKVSTAIQFSTTLFSTTASTSVSSTTVYSTSISSTSVSSTTLVSSLSTTTIFTLCGQGSGTNNAITVTSYLSETVPNDAVINYTMYGGGGGGGVSSGNGLSGSTVTGNFIIDANDALTIYAGGGGGGGGSGSGCGGNCDGGGGGGSGYYGGGGGGNGEPGGGGGGGSSAILVNGVLIQYANGGQGGTQAPTLTEGCGGGGGSTSGGSGAGEGTCSGSNTGSFTAGGSGGFGTYGTGGTGGSGSGGGSGGSSSTSFGGGGGGGGGYGGNGGAGGVSGNGLAGGAADGGTGQAGIDSAGGGGGSVTLKWAGATCPI